MKKRSLILSSILTLVMCLSLIVGSTFALFTSESKTNIAVTSGNVEVVAWLDDIETKTFGTVQAENTFELGGGATYDATANKLTVDKMAPGDSVSLNVYIENKSNISVSYMVSVTFVGELQEKLVAKITLPQDVDATVLTANDVATDWQSFDDTNKVTLPMSIELPYEVGSEYMDKSAEIIVTVEAVQANGTNLVMLNNTKYASVAEAVAVAEDGATIELYNGTFDFIGISLANKTLTFKGDNAVINLRHKNFPNTTGATLTFDGVTLKFFDTNDYYQGLTHSTKLVYNNCTLKGLQFLYAPTVEFNGCTFENKVEYSVWTYGATDVKFTQCDFYTGGKAILLYTESEHHATITVDECKFYDDGTYVKGPKAAVEVGSSPNSAATTYNVNINNSTVDGFETNNSTSALWGNKDNMDADHLKITLDGTPVDVNPAVVAPGTLAELQQAFADAASQATGDIVINITQDFDAANGWTAVSPEGYNGVNNVVVNGNGHKITNLNEPLFVGAFGGYGSITINDLTIADSNITHANYNGMGLGAFVTYSDSSNSLVLDNCHLVNSTVKCTDGYAGGLVGYASTLAKFTNCSVTESVIDGKKSAGAIIGHGANVIAKDCTVTGNTIQETLEGRDSAGAAAIAGRISGGILTLEGTITVTGNTIVQGAQAPAAGNIYTALGTPVTTGATLVTD